MIKKITQGEFNGLVEKSFKFKDVIKKYKKNRANYSIILGVFSCPLVACDWNCHVTLHDQTDLEVRGNLATRLKKHLFAVHNIKVKAAEKYYKPAFVKSFSRGLSGIK